MKRLLTSVLGTASAVAMATTATAQTGLQASSMDLSDIDLSQLTSMACTPQLEAAEALSAASMANAGDALRDYAKARADWQGDFALSPEALSTDAFRRNTFQNPTQVVYLRFNDADPTFQVFDGIDENGDPIPFMGGVFPDYIFTEDDIANIVGQLETAYALFDVTFTTEQPSQGDFTTIRIGFNDDNPINIGTGQILFGQADTIDFGNDNRNDGAFVDASLWQLLAEIDLASGTQLLQNNLNLPEPLSPEEIEETRQFPVVNQSADTAAHELGHILGLRHHDSIGAPGTGLPTSGAVQPDDFFPVLETELGADETFDHLMATNASVGLPLEGSVLFDRFFSERSANKLTFNEVGRLTPEEDTFRFGLRFIPFAIRMLANPLVTGDNAGARLISKSWAVDASIDELGEEDAYALYLVEGEVFNAEIISTSDQAIEDDIFGKLTLSYSNPATGQLEEVAVNQTSFEGRDSLLFDFTVPQTGFYELKVTAPDEIPFEGEIIRLSEIPDGETGGTLYDVFGLGDYELFAYRIEARPTGNTLTAQNQ